jgi:beta-galactosidase GanA
MDRFSFRKFNGLLSFSLSLFAILTACLSARAADAPRIEHKDGRSALMVDGRPYLILGGQIHNSSAWPSELPQVWESMAALHANTMGSPVYWEQIEPQQGRFDFSNVDQIVEGARTHNLHLALLWFGTWKNGNMHYVPTWVKGDTKRFPRIIRPDGEPIDVLSPHSRNNLEADKAAFVALTRHLKQIDGEQHTILLIQVENESGNIGSVRDNSPESNKEFASAVPADMLAAAHMQPGTWKQVFGADADEIFQVYHQAKYINEIAAAG